MVQPVPHPSRAVSRCERTDSTVTFFSEYGALRLEPVSPEIVRVRFTREDTFSQEAKPGVLPFSPFCSWKLNETKDAYTLLTDRLALTIDKTSLFICYRTRDGKLLLRENPRDSRTLEAYDSYLPNPEEPARMERVRTPDGEKVIPRDIPRVYDRRLYRCRLNLFWQEGEALYGLGQHEEGLLNLRGHTVYLHQANLKIAVPLLVSSLGYGILTDTYGPAIFRDDVFSSSIFTEADMEMDHYFLYGGNLDGVIHSCRTLTGKAAMLPRWAFGFVQSQERYETAAEMLDTAREYRRRGVGLDCIVLDWCSWEDGMWGQKTLDPARFPDPASFLAELHRKQVRFMVSIWPNMDEKTDDYRAFAERDLLLPFSNLYDATRAEGRALYWEQVRQNLYRYGVDAWWCDSSEPFTPEWTHQEKPDPAQMYQEYVENAGRQMPLRLANAYALFHAQGIYEGQRAESEEKRVVNLTRSAALGQQRYGAILWSGDTSASWQTLRRQIAAGLNFCASGLPYWTVDIGGFFVKRGDTWFWNGEYEDGCRDEGYRELYTRWYQFAAFLPMFRAHGTDTRREIWHYGDEGGAYYEAMKAANRLRYRLMPYLYSEAGHVWKDDKTLLRLLAFDFADDPNALDIADQFLFGQSLLVCPVTQPAVLSRSVYLPKGCDWYDLHTNHRYCGGQTIDAQTSLESIPVFVRAGSIVPVGRASQYAGEDTGTRPVLCVYPGCDAHFSFYEDDGDGYGYECGEYTMTEMHWDDAAQRFSAVCGGEDCSALYEVRVMGEGKEGLPDLRL